MPGKIGLSLVPSPYVGFGAHCCTAAMYSGVCTVSSRARSIGRWRDDRQPVEHAELVGQRDGVGDPARGHRVVDAEVVLGQSSEKTSRPLIRVRPVRRRHPGRPRPAPGCGCGPPRSRPMNAARTLWSSSWRTAAAVVPPGEVTRSRSTVGMLPGLPEQLGRAEHGLHHQLGGDVARQSEVHAGLDHRLDDEEQVRRAGPGDRGHRILVALRHGDHAAGGGQDLRHPVQMIVVAVRAGGDGGHALVDLGRSVGHHPDHGDALGQLGLDGGGVDTGGQRDDQRVGLDRLGDLGQQFAHVLRLDHQDHRVGLGHRLVVLQHGDRRTWRRARPGARAAGRWPRSGPRTSRTRSSPESRVSPITPAPRMASRRPFATCSVTGSGPPGRRPAAG